MKKTLKIICLNVAITITLYFCLELIALISILVSGNSPHFMRANAEHRKLFEQHPYLVARVKSNISLIKEDVKITTDNQNRRITGQQRGTNDKIKIAVIGGSTTFCTGVSDENTWPYQLQTMLGNQYYVANYGCPGYSTAEALIQINLVIPELDPDIYIFLEGWNDLRNYHISYTNSDYYGHGMAQFYNLGVYETIPKNYFDAYKKYSPLFSMLSFNKPKSFDFTKGSSEPDAFIDQIYQRNVQNIISQLKNNKKTIVFLEQVLNSKEYEGKTTSRDWTPYIQDKAVPELMKRMNSLTKNICQQNEVAFLKNEDGFKIVESDFIDDGHLNSVGCKKIASVLKEWVKANSIHLH